MIYLSQLILNPASRMVQNELHNPYQMHRTLMRGFNGRRETANVLYRLDVHPYSGMLALLVQSTEEPDWQPLTQTGQGKYLLAPPTCKAIDPPLQNGQILQFRLVANPSVKREGKRHALYKEEEQRRWLETKGIGCPEKKRPPLGFRVLEMDVQKPRKRYSTKGKLKMIIYTVQYDGRLQITDVTKFQKALQKGIGPAKAFGCGLLSIAPG
ncbi:MAG: type I-E CRISPR-associated protein Cas6/Cse3/CasE [Chloroflexi bacterium]|nr:MAG: type I-E CRISPR-associated protein Cas6/Cse3/CasE [Chloroflexota bacterium]